MFLPLLAKLGFDRLVADAGYPGSKMIPAASALLSLLTLKLLDKERRSHISDFNFDEALGLFAGLNILPKKSFATDYSYRAGREQQQSLLSGWVRAIGPLMFPDALSFSLDFHALPIAANRQGLIAITCRDVASPVRVCSHSSPWNKKAVACVTPTQISRGAIRTAN